MDHPAPRRLRLQRVRLGPSIKATRTATAPFGDVGLPVIDPDDIAAVAAVAEAIGEPVTFIDQTARRPAPRCSPSCRPR